MVECATNSSREQPRTMVRTKGPAQAALQWRVLGLLNLFRLLVPLVLASLHYLLPDATSVGWADPALFQNVVIAYFAAGILMIAALKNRWPQIEQQAWVHIALDVTAVALLVYTSGGVASGLGMLLVIPVAAVSLITRRAFVIAGGAAIALLFQQATAQLAGFASVADYTGAGVLGATLFVVALAVLPLGERIRATEELVRQRDVDLANLAELSQYIVQHLRESILVIDGHDRIRLINESAAQMLGDEQAYPDALIGETSPRLLYLLESWRQASTAPPSLPAPDSTFVAADGARVIRPHFAPLGRTDPAPVLVFLEDTSLLDQKVQQSKLAALGRLSASIAHEIRNPVGAMSHAGQLLAESPQLTEEDRRLTAIIRSNADRVSGIIENIQRLSRREPAQLERLALGSWAEEFHEEFCETMQWPRARMQLSGATREIEVRVDPNQLRQIVWNLCENALKHAIGTNPDQSVELRCGRMSGSARPFLEVADRGKGVAPEHAERIFEPFYSGGEGTGLGLFLARELAQSNGATLLYEPRADGGSMFRLVFADPRRWEI